jgi:hypothetical protein
MEGNQQGHPSAEDLENYSLGRLPASRISGFEEHLFICQRCRSRLNAIEPYNFVHYTNDGPFYSRITGLRNRKFLARHWGRSLEGGKEFATKQGAKAYLLRTFGRIFPEHACTARCGPTNGG